jgi:uncharacterized damage-inducible protein DinB
LISIEWKIHYSEAAEKLFNITDKPIKIAVFFDGGIMFSTINGFKAVWEQERDATLKVLRNLTDASLAKAITPEERTIGRVAWHIVITIPEMMEHLGLAFPGISHKAPVPKTAKEIAEAYEKVSASVLEQITANWTDETLKVEDEMYGQKWTRSASLQSLVFHQIHHRGQLTVLMRQAGLKFPGVYGPAREEWATYGAPPPEV